MEYYPQNNKGFAVDYDLAEKLEFIEELILWEEEWNDIPLIEFFEERFGLAPERVRYFEYSRGGEVQGLQGFDYDSTYILFDTDADSDNPEGWEKFGRVRIKLF